MRKYGNWVSLVVLASSLLFLTSCNRVLAKQPATQYITLNYNGGSCQQNGSTGVIDIFQNAPVVYQGSANPTTQFQVQFSSTCPFAACPVNSPSGTAVTAGTPTQGPGTYNYSSLTIKNQSCSGAGSMGIRLKPGP